MEPVTVFKPVPDGTLVKHYYPDPTNKDVVVVGPAYRLANDDEYNHPAGLSIFDPSDFTPRRYVPIDDPA